MTADPGTAAVSVGAASSAHPVPQTPAATPPGVATSASPSAQPIVGPLSPVAPPADKIGADIAKILQDVKLPDRRGQKIASVPEGQAPALGALPRFEQKTPAVSVEKEVPAVVLPPQAPASDGEKKQEDGIAAPITSLHTMKSDLQGVVRDRKISVVRAASMEQDRRVQQDSPRVSGTPRRRGGDKLVLILTATLLLFALGGAAIYAVYTLSSGSSPVAQGVSGPAVLFAENQSALTLDGQSSSALKQVLGALLSQPGSVGSITQIIPTLTTADTQSGQRPATLQEFFTALDVEAPGDLMRALSGEFFLGIHMADVPSPIFIIPVVSYDRAFAGMLAWEPSINTDLAALFKHVPNITASPSGGLPVQRQFKDLVVRNYDVRGLADDSGTIVLYYSFPTPQILIIAASPYTFPEVLSRLQAERKL